ncbi:MAG TPA: hypothetical protein PLQ42_12725, partial [Candidatus Hydrogenedentes bacterium]|nr:hypothetical protein [Candidatus Hydrogenedentota bacterium]
MVYVLWGMSRDIIPALVNVCVFFMTRLYANAEIGVPREDLHFSGAASVPPVIPAPPPVIPAPPPVIPAPPPVI